MESDVTVKNADGSVETIDTTDSHPFYVQGQGWVSADDLLAGETLSTPNGQTATVVETTTVAEPQGVLVYNFTVADDHTYFVEGFGSNATTGSAAGPLDAVWVHNTCNVSSNTVYRSLDANGETQYVGITNNFERRAAEHLVQTGMKIERIQGLSGLSRYDARAAEQALIEKYGFSSDGGTLRNIYNSIAKLNPNYSAAIERGLQLLQTVGL